LYGPASEFEQGTNAASFRLLLQGGSCKAWNQSLDASCNCINRSMRSAFCTECPSLLIACCNSLKSVEFFNFSISASDSLDIGGATPKHSWTIESNVVP